MPDSDWIEVGDSPTVRTRIRFQECADGSVDMTIWQAPRDLGTFLAQLKAESDAAERNGWRDGAIVGRVPDALYYTSGLAQARYQNDKAWIAKFFNDSDHRDLRVKQGRL